MWTDKPQREYKRGEVYFMNFGNRPGRVQRGMRPGVICQPDEGSNSLSFMVAPISASKRTPRPYLQEIYLRKSSYIHYEQLTSMDVNAIEAFIYRLNRYQMQELDLRIPVATGTENASLLHYENIKIISRKEVEGVLTYYGTVKMVFREKELIFTDQDFKSYFPIDYHHYMKPMTQLGAISDLLMTLPGLKFVYEMLR